MMHMPLSPPYLPLQPIPTSFFLAPNPCRLANHVDFVVCLGGDGVILHASSLFKQHIPPVVSFHLGSMGFLTNHPFPDFKQELRQVRCYVTCYMTCCCRACRWQHVLQWLPYVWQ
jgi:NAD kinase